MIISILYDKDKRPFVRVRGMIDKVDIIFDTGDIVKDYEDAVNFVNERSIIGAYLSSSVDEFVIEHSDEFEWDDTDLIVRKNEAG